MAATQMTPSPSLRARDAETEITLGLLTAIEQDSHVTQRSAASQLGIALGLANAFLKRCIKKGLVKVQQVPANRYAYYLTPKGFAEKSRLTSQYLQISFDFFRHARMQCTEVLDTCQRLGFARVALIGTGDLGEIMILCARDLPVTLTGFIDAAMPADSFAGLPVLRSLAAAQPVDALIVIDMAQPQAAYDQAVASFPETKVLAPRFLNITQRKST